MIEPAVAWLSENQRLSRTRASAYAGLACWLLGLGTLLSFNSWSDLTVAGMTFFELIDFITANVMLPAGGLLVALFAGWVMRPQDSAEELEAGCWYPYWQLLIRYVAPIAVAIILWDATGSG